MKRARDRAVQVHGDGETTLVLGHGIGGNQAHWAEAEAHDGVNYALWRSRVPPDDVPPSRQEAATVRAHLPPGVHVRPPAAVPEPATPASTPLAATMAADSKTETPEAVGFPAIPGIDRAEAASRLQGNRDLFYAVLRALRDEFSEVPEQARADLDRGDPACAAARMHKLTGIAGNAAAKGVTTAARAVEVALDADHREKALSALLALEAALNELLPHLPFDLDCANAEGVTGANMASDIASEEIAEFKSALARSSARALKIYRALRPRLLARWGASDLAPLATAMEAMQFAEALKRLNLWYP